MEGVKDEGKRWGMVVVVSPCADKTQLFYEGAGAADSADPRLQDLLQGLVHVSQAVQVHTVPQTVIQPGQTQGEDRTVSAVLFVELCPAVGPRRFWTSSGINGKYSTKAFENCASPPASARVYTQFFFSTGGSR